jgi:hypothetical protein
MKNLLSKKVIVLLLAFFFVIPVCEAQRYKRSIRNPERYQFGKSLNKKNVKVKESPSVVRAKKKQAANEKKVKKEYDDYVKESRKRAVKIQSPEVQARMLDNRKESDLKYKEKKKKMAENSRKTGRKYRK